MINNMLFSRSEVDVLWENELKNRAIFSYNDKVAYARVLANTMLDRVTPFVKGMVYDYSNEVIAVQDDLADAIIRYYINLQGDVCSLAYVDGEQALFPINFVDEEDSEPFQTYYKDKDEISSYISEKRYRMRKTNADNCLRMALSAKNK